LLERCAAADGGDRSTEIAERHKPVTQCFSHALELLYFVPALSIGSIQRELVVAVFVTTILKRMSDANFRRYSRAIIYTVGVAYLGRATLLLW
jgi:hypothetical protein